MTTTTYKCRLSKSPIFWTVNSIDKPSQQYFKNNIEWIDVNFTPNWVDQFTATIVTDTSDYTLMEIQEITTDGENETIKTFYFTNSNINKKLKNGYLLQFDLDVYLTYFYDLVSFIENKPIKINRLYYYDLFNNFNYWNIILANIDPLLDFSNFQYYQMSIGCDNISGNATLPQVDYLHNAGISINTSNVNYSLSSAITSTGRASAGVTGYVYQLLSGDYLIIYNFQNSNIKIKWDANNNLSVIEGAQVHKIIQNKSEFSWLQNKFVGIFTIPFYLYIKDVSFWRGLGYYTNGDISQNKQYVRPATSGEISGAIVTILEQTKTYILQEYIQTPTTINWGETLWNLDNSTFKNNFDVMDFTKQITTPNYMLFSKLEYENYGLPIMSPYLRMYSNSYLSFDGNKFNTTPIYNYESIGSWINPAYITNNIIQHHGTFATSTNSYSEYINSVKSQQNTSIEIAKQQYDLNNFSNTYGTISGIFSSVASGNIFGAIDKSVNGIVKNISNLYKYQNTQKQIDAKNLDTHNVARAKNITSSVTSDDIFNKRNQVYLSNNDNRICTTYNIKLGTRTQNIIYNNMLNKYGYYINLIIPSSSDYFYPENDKNNNTNYNVIDFEIDDYLINNFLSNENETLKNSLKIIMENSFRIWKNPMTETNNKILIKGFNA